MGGLVGCGACTVWFYGACFNANLLLRSRTITSLSLPNERLMKEAAEAAEAALRARMHCSGSGAEQPLRDPPAAAAAAAASIVIGDYLHRGSVSDLLGARLVDGAATYEACASCG